MADWWDNILTNVGQGLNNATTNPQLAPALGAAYHFYNQADKYGEMGTQLGKDANPFGDRSQYVQGLSNLYNDPSSIENSAAYKFRLSQGLNTLGPQQAAKGGGYGNAQASMMKYAQDMASQEYDKEWQRLYEAGGGKFDPANAAKLQLDAAGLEANAKGAALDALFTPFKPGNSTTINNGVGPGGSATNPGSTWNAGSGGATGNLGATGKWISEGANIGKYMLNDGTVIDVTKLSEAARAGDQDAIAWLTRISGGGSVDEQIRNLGTYEGGDTGDPYNPGLPDDGGGYNPDDGLYPTLPDNPTLDFDTINDGLGMWFDP